MVDFDFVYKRRNAMNDQPYLIPEQLAIFEEEIKKSVFITQLAHTPTIEAAKAFVDQVKHQHASARHNCWAFVAGRPEDSMKWGFSDDGEPSGTAGKPILAQLSGSGVGEVTAVVTRYSGGIKLGTGGLVKAYGGGVQQALKLLQTIEKKITIQMRVELDYGFMPILQAMLASYDAQELAADYSDQVVLTIDIERQKADEFALAVTNKSAAKARVSTVK